MTTTTTTTTELDLDAIKARNDHVKSCYGDAWAESASESSKDRDALITEVERLAARWKSSQLGVGELIDRSENIEFKHTKVVSDLTLLRAQFDRLEAAAEDVLAEAESEFRHSEPLKKLRFAVLEVPVGSVEQSEATMSTTVKAVTARKRHRCDESSWVGIHFIAPGHRYLRHVAFPGDDVNGSDQPWVLRQCVACAEDREQLAGTLTAGACSTFCCGDVPCALPLKHDGDHSCRRDAADAARREVGVR